MALPLYLAMTKEEMANCDPLPEQGVYMACHFSLYGTGLCNIPETLPPGWILMVNDRIPIWRHDPNIIAAQLMEAAPEALLLDFQQADQPQALAIAEKILETLPCPTALSEGYARELSCPVFLCPPPLHQPLSEHIAPWQGRDIWLDLAMDAEQITVTKEGSHYSPLPRFSPEGICHRDSKLHCSYLTEVFPDRAEFTLTRTKEDILDLLTDAEELGITRAIGLYQEHNK